LIDAELIAGRILKIRPVGLVKLLVVAGKIEYNAFESGGFRVAIYFAQGGQ